MDEPREDDPTTQDEVSGMPEGAPEADPLGVPKDADAPEPGEEAMPGIAEGGEPPSSG